MGHCNPADKFNTKKMQYRHENLRARKVAGEEKYPNCYIKQNLWNCNILQAYTDQRTYTDTKNNPDPEHVICHSLDLVLVKSFVSDSRE